MIRVDIQYHSDGTGHMQKAAVVFTGLCHKDPAVPHPAASADRIQPAADMDAGILSVVHEDLAQHGGRCGFSVCPADSNSPGKALHQLAQQPGPLQTGNPKPFRFHPFRIIGMNRR